jgi:hypothetical protein
MWSPSFFSVVDHLVLKSEFGPQRGWSLSVRYYIQAHADEKIGVRF